MEGTMKKGTRKVRIAKVTNPSHDLFGQKFIVISWRDRVRCWGHVTSYNRGTKHQGRFDFDSNDVEIINDVLYNSDLYEDLWNQYIDYIESRGAIINHNRKSYSIIRKPFSSEFIAIAKELGYEIQELNQEDIDAINELI